MTLRCLELFSGAGGLAHGLELAGLRHLAFVERNRHACASLAENFGAERVFCGDIRDFSLDLPGSVDVVAGGPPCQPFSLGGKHQADQDQRDMFPHAIRAIEQLMPKAFVFENVKGLLRQSFAEYFQYILLRLSYPGVPAGDGDWQGHLARLRKVSSQPYSGVRYDVHFQLVNAADYGVPQTRERVFIVGVRSDLGLDWHFPAATHSEERLLWDMWVSGDYWQRHGLPAPVADASQRRLATRLQARHGLFAPDSLPWRSVRDALHDLPDPLSAHGIADHLFRDGARSYPGHTGSDYDWPSKTIKAGDHGVPGGENMIRYPDDRLRYFTVLEAKRIQTFPDDYRITGAWGEAMRQIGNAVPVELARVIGRQLLETLQQRVVVRAVG